MSLAVGAVAGGAVISWKNGSKISDLESRAEIAEFLNSKCDKDVQSAKAGLKQVTDALAEKEREAQAAMLSAKWAEMARKIRNAPIQEGESQCQAVEREQREYVKARSPT